MRKLLIILLTIIFTSILITNTVNAEEYIEEYLDGITESINRLDNYSEDYQDGYRRGYEEAFSHKNRIKVELWSYSNIRVNILDNVYRFIFGNFVQTYDIFSVQGLTKTEIINKVYIPTFEGYIYPSEEYNDSYATDARQWFLGTSNFLLYVEKGLIDSIMSRDNVDIITAFRTYLQENNIYGYFERASGLTDYEIGYNNGYEQGFNTAMKDTTTKLMSSVFILVGPILLISVILQMFNKFKSDN